MAHWTIRADYDPEASVWYSVDGDIPGLAADATTLEALAAKAGAMLPDLLDIHADDIADPARLAGPHRIRIIAHHERISRLRPDRAWSGAMPRRFVQS